MVDNVTNLNAVRTAEEASRLLNDKALVDAVVAVEKQYMEAMLNLKDTDTDGIQNCRLGIKSLRLVLQHLNRQVMNGELSAYELDQLKGKKRFSFMPGE